MALNADYKYTEDFKFTAELKNDFKRHGYIILRDLLDEEELINLKKSVENNAKIAQNSYGLADTEGRFAKQTLWHTAGDDVAGMVARCEKVVNTSEELLGGEVYHYHTKLMMKDAKNPETGGGIEWHQDYGAHKDNGCLQILDGSHNCGRIDHKSVAGGQQSPDEERINAIANVCPLKFVELQQGDAIFLHGNFLHRSGPNNSQDRRYAFLIAYNKVSNNPVKEHHFKRYTPLHKVPNSAIKECTDYKIGDFFDPDTQKAFKLKRLGLEQ